jgi:hypothetical protein
MGQKLAGIPESEDKEGIIEDDESDTIGMGRTPTSSSKRLYLERLFATPTTLRFATMMEDEENNQPQRILYQKAEEAHMNDKEALASGTPSFLRRSNSGRYVNSSNDNDSANPLSPVGVRKHQRYNGKGLSALVQGLRDMENERMEDDWDILNEIEAEQNNGTAGDNVQVGDSQVPPDAAGEDPKGGRVWKKKGQKRTTRLVKMKPVMQVKSKPPRTTTTKQPKNTDQSKDEEEDEESEDELQTSANARSVDAGENSLPPTRTLRERKQTTEDNPIQDDASEEDAYNDINSDDNSDDSDFAETASTKQTLTTTTTKPMSSFSEKLKAAFSAVQPLKKKKTVAAKKDDEDKKKPSSPKKRKVNPDAHANYRSLKIRSKGQGRFGRGRFGRR